MALLPTVLTDLQANNIRVAVTLRANHANLTHPYVITVEGYIRQVEDTTFRLYTRITDYWGASYDCEADWTVQQIVATKGKRRKAGLHYEVYYTECPFVLAPEGEIDMSATLRQLLTA